PWNNTRMPQITFFLTGAFLVTWSMCFALRTAAFEGGLWVLLGWLLPSVWAPTILALDLTARPDGLSGVKREIDSLKYRGGLVHWLLIAALVPAMATAISVSIGRAAGDSGPFTPSGGILVMIGLQLVSGAIGEELGWRGFLLRRLENRMA